VSDEQVVVSERLRLEPLSMRHVDALFPVLDDPALHRFIGGDPRTARELARWIEKIGTPPAGERWINWVVLRRDDGEVVGTVQATLVGEEASIAWVTGTEFQGHGYAKEAAARMVEWLRAESGVTRLQAEIHPDHLASQAVARSLGLEPTDEIDDGEVVWRSPATDP
jgi:RimJ/RimL family protein N-acetyltransferase